MASHENVKNEPVEVSKNCAEMRKFPRISVMGELLIAILSSHRNPKKYEKEIKPRT